MAASAASAASPEATSTYHSVGRSVGVGVKTRKFLPKFLPMRALRACGGAVCLGHEVSGLRSQEASNKMGPGKWWPWALAGQLSVWGGGARDANATLHHFRLSVFLSSIR